MTPKEVRSRDTAALIEDLHQMVKVYTLCAGEDNDHQILRAILREAANALSEEQRRSEVYAAERDQARAMRDRAVAIFSAIHSACMDSGPVEVNGKSYIFDPVDKEIFWPVHQRLCKLIREIPERVREFGGGDYAGQLETALRNLLAQVEKFCEENGEADFYTGEAHAALKGSDGGEARESAVGGAQLTQAGGDSGGMPLSVGRSRPDQTATNSGNGVVHYPEAEQAAKDIGAERDYPFHIRYPEKLPCEVYCLGGPSFGKGVHTRALLAYLNRRVEHNKDTSLDHTCGLPEREWSREGPSKDCPLCKARAGFADLRRIVEVTAALPPRNET